MNNSLCFNSYQCTMIELTVSGLVCLVSMISGSFKCVSDNPHWHAGGFSKSLHLWENQLISISHYLFKTMLSCSRICFCGCVLRRKTICEWMFEESITLPWGHQLSVFTFKCAWVCLRLHNCMCVFRSICGFPDFRNSSIFEAYPLKLIVNMCHSYTVSNKE